MVRPQLAGRIGERFVLPGETIRSIRESIVKILSPIVKMR